MPLGIKVMNQVLDMFLEYNVLIIGTCVLIYFLLEFKQTYFPSEPRVYELSDALMELNLRRKYVWKTSKYLENLNLRTRL